MHLTYFQLFILAYLAYLNFNLKLVKSLNCSELKIYANIKQSLSWNERFQFYKCLEKQEEVKKGKTFLLGGPSIINGSLDVNVIPLRVILKRFFYFFLKL